MVPYDTNNAGCRSQFRRRRSIKTRCHIRPRNYRPFGFAFRLQYITWHIKFSITLRSSPSTRKASWICRINYICTTSGALYHTPSTDLYNMKWASQRLLWYRIFRQKTTINADRHVILRVFTKQPNHSRHRQLCSAMCKRMIIEWRKT